MPHAITEEHHGSGAITPIHDCTRRCHHQHTSILCLGGSGKRDVDEHGCLVPAYLRVSVGRKPRPQPRDGIQAVVHLLAPA